MNDKSRKTFRNVLVVALNVILILGLVITFFVYDNGYKQKLYSQNLDEIANINQASANIASTFFTGREAKLRDIALYVERNRLTLAESMDFIHSSNSDKSKFFEMIGESGAGYRIEKDADGAYIPLYYDESYGTVSTIFPKNALITDSQAVHFAPEFTDGYTAMRSFALYNSLRLVDERGAAVPYTLMVVSTSADFISMININSGYERLATTIINEAGDYIIGNSAFKSDNFFRFLAEFNDLSLDQRKEIEARVAATVKGSLAYKDGRGRDSVFVYTPVPDKDWYCVTVVPVSNFRNSGTEFSFALIVVAVMLLLLTTDLLYLAALNRKLKRSVENERIASAAKTDFLARMSHDMRTPMNGIIGMTRLTEDIPGLPDEARGNLAAISDSSAYLLQLINDTLDMNKIESSKFTLNPETVNARELVDHILSAVRPLADQKQIELEFVPIHAEPDYILADRMRVQQIFLNILSNAVKFTPEHGKIRIEAECLKRENGIVCDRISVEDNGCGMEADFLLHIFEPFSQEKSKIVSGQEGTGLGMAIVKNLVELMGGKIEIASEPGLGTKVTVYLCFERVCDAPAETIARQSTDGARLEGKRVLLAEDHPLNATIAERILQKKGMLVEHAENGALATQMFSRSEPGYYDIILMDIRMPEMDGLEATRKIRALSRQDAGEIPIIAMTANAYAEDVQAALDAGMNAHLAKPIEPETLYAELLQYC